MVSSFQRETVQDLGANLLTTK
uniref:Uncharacterized protein n=1 Tax=Arundo donax TaxID=35708 RepID=A0A0A9C1K2_ARUDO